MSYKRTIELSIVFRVYFVIWCGYTYFIKIHLLQIFCVCEVSPLFLVVSMTLFNCMCYTVTLYLRFWLFPVGSH
jgi:hypothetical protein